MKENEARIIARLIAKIIVEKEAAYDYVKEEVAKLCASFPLYADCIK
jgi:glycine/serine hydroxymethyltransferase